MSKLHADAISCYMRDHSRLCYMQESFNLSFNAPEGEPRIIPILLSSASHMKLLFMILKTKISINFRELKDYKVESSMRQDCMSNNACVCVCVCMSCGKGKQLTFPALGVGKAQQPGAWQ